MPDKKTVQQAKPAKKSWFNLSRKPEDVPLGTGAAGQAKKAIQTRQQKIDAAIKASGG